MAAEGRFGRAAVEEHMPDLRAGAEQAGEIIGLDAVAIDRAIQAARAAAARDHVPQRHSGIVEPRQAFLVGQLESGAEQPAHDGPERVARMGVVLRRRQRSLARHAAEDQHPRIGTAHRPKAADLRRSPHQDLITHIGTDSVGAVSSRTI